MKKTEGKELRKGLSLSTTIIVMAAIATIAASSVVIVEIEEGGGEPNIVPEPPMFELIVEPLHRDAHVNETVSYVISFELYVYTWAPLELEVLDMYDGVMSSLDHEEIYPGETAVLNLTPMCEGWFFREIVGTFEGQEDTEVVTLMAEHENDNTTSAFELCVEPMTQTTSVNMPAVYTLFLETEDDFDDMVDLEVMDCYDGVISVLYPRSIGPGESANLMLTPMFPGEFTRTIVGTSSHHTDEVEVELLVPMDTV